MINQIINPDLVILLMFVWNIYQFYGIIKKNKQILDIEDKKKYFVWLCKQFNVFEKLDELKKNEKRNTAKSNTNKVYGEMATA